MKALIIAGGIGSRLKEVTKNLYPKPLVKLRGRALIEYAIENLIKYNIDEIFISVGYLHEQIEEYVNSKKYNVKINYLVENEPLGSGGSLFYLKDKINDDFIVCMGDVLFDINILKMYEYHKEKKSLITLLVHPNSHPKDSDLIVFSKSGKVLKLDKKNTHKGYYSNNVNAGFFIINSKALTYFKEESKKSLEHDFIKYFIDKKDAVYAYKSTEYIKDVGTPERYEMALLDIQSKKPQKKNLENKQKAIFLDRDGTINVYNGFIRKPEEFELIEGVCEAIKDINKSTYLAIVVTNQPVIARGECSRKTLKNIFNKMETLLGEKGAFLDGIYYCPHHQDKGFLGEIKSLKIKCCCRKPNIGMIEQAKRDFNLDLSQCYFIGDSKTDIETAKNANIQAVKVLTGPDKSIDKDACSNFDSLMKAVGYILNKK